MDFNHKPVLLEECLDGLNIKPDGTFLDGTIGGAGHAVRILERLNKHGRLIGIDQDGNAVRAAAERLAALGKRTEFQVVHSNFLNVEKICNDLKIEQVDGILLDLGVSSHQFDVGERGFSYQQNVGLDMRMDQTAALTAEDIVNDFEEDELIRIIREYGEEKWAVRIGKFIVERRSNGRIKTTGELVDIIKAAIPKSARRDGPHPAKRTFQAIRIAVNDELNVLKNVIGKCINVLAVGGRLCIISFHSLEDRIVKNEFREYAVDCICPKEYPVCMCNHHASAKIITKKPILPTEQEIEENPRARSAKLRILEKTTNICI